MAHNATKQAACANCHHRFAPGEPNDFCPSCGQQNHAVEISIGHVVEEFLEGIFHFDGKVFRTAGLLLFKPGELTGRFLAGHRVPYVPPIRLYVFISFVFFLLLGTQFGHEEPADGPKHGQAETVSFKLDSLANRAKLRRALANAPADSAAHPVAAAHSAKEKNANALPSAKKAAQTADEDDDDANPKAVRKSLTALAQIRRLPARLTNAQVDSVVRSKGWQPGFFNRLGVRRVVRWRDSSREEIIHQVLRGTSILLFLLMPLAALLLKGAYFRQHRYYLSHLVFTIHVQCFLFLYFIGAILLSKLAIPDFIISLLWLVPVVYFVVALHTFYQQSWLKTVGKSLLLGVAYSLTLAFSLMSVAILGAFLF